MHVDHSEVDRRTLLRAGLGAATVAVVGSELAFPGAAQAAPGTDLDWIISCDEWAARPPKDPLSVSAIATNKIIVAGNNEERPFTRDQRRWVYASAKQENNYFGFGTDNDIEYTPGYPIIKHRTFGRAVPPSSPTAGHDVRLPCAKVLGAARGRARAFRPESVVNISGMSFGSLSGNAIDALNQGAALAGCLQNTGEGGLSPYHRNGGELVFQTRHGVLRLPRRARPVQPRPAEGPGRRRTGAGAGDQAEPGREARPRRAAARGEGVRRDRRHPRHPGRSGLRQPVPARRVLRLPTACSTGWSCWPPRPGCRSASSPRSVT